MEIVNCDAVDEAIVDSSVVELDSLAVEPCDEAPRFEIFEAVLAALFVAHEWEPTEHARLSRLTQRGAEIADDISRLFAAISVGHEINLVVRGFEVPVIQQHVDGNQRSEWSRADELIIVPRPLADYLVAARLRPEPPCRLLRGVATRQRPALQVIVRRLMETDGPQDSRCRHFTLRLFPEFHAPESAVGVADVIAGVRAGGLPCHEGVSS